MKKMVSLALGASAAAIAAGTAAPAAAQCAPDPTVANGTTTCAGTDADGLVVTTNATVVVAENARVEAAQGRPGAITLAPPQPNGFTTAIIRNTGVITSSTGAAVTWRNDPNRVGLSSLSNLAGGTISGAAGAIDTAVQVLDNAGRIDGGAGSAVSYNSLDGFGLIYSSVLINSGTMSASSTAPTLALGELDVTIRNSGRIENKGAGPAIDTANLPLRLENASTGVIASGGPVALRSGALNVINAGLITGSVEGGSGTGFSFLPGDRVDTRAGVIDGDVSLNDGADELVVRLGDTRLVGSVTGAVDGGAGVDVLELVVDRDRTWTGGVLPTGFEVMQLTVANGATLTLAALPPSPGGYHLRGTGTVAIGTDMVTIGRVLDLPYRYMNVGSEALNLVNNRTIATTLTSASDFAIRLFDVERFSNTGSITAAGGGGVLLRSTGDAVTTNGGFIAATGTALQVDRRLVNTGLIRSTSGAAVVNGLGGGTIRSVTSENSGRVEGGTIGYNVSSLVLVNTGSISASAGVGVAMSGSRLENRASGVISGTTAAIRTDGFSGEYVLNAGTINGLVDFGASAQFSGARDWLIDRGGTINGGVRMGGGDDVVVVDLARDSAGVTGAMDGGPGNDQFRFRTATDASATVAAPRTGFESIAYEVANGAKLTLTAAAPLATTIGMSGEGVVDVTADSAQTARPAFDLTEISSDQILGDAYYVPANKLEVISRGTLDLTVGSGGGDLAAVRAGVAVFENVGAINVTGDGNTALATGVLGWTSFTGSGGAVIRNSGTITLTGANLAGVRGGAELINTGRITGAGGTGSSAAVGVAGTSKVVNSGIIEVNGVGVSLGSSFGFGGSGSVINSGTITSTGSSAVRSIGIGGSVDNQAGGVITGRGAIYLPGGAVANAGTINGTVQLTTFTQSGPGYEPAAFASAGGTVNGSVLFGAGDDLFLQFGDTTGVTRTVDGGAGEDTFGRAFSANATVALGELGGVNFERQLIQARGADTTVTITGEAANMLFVGGDGRIVNQATIAGDLTTYAPYDGFYYGSALPDAFGSGLLLTEFHNEGALRGGFDGYVKSFVNAGAIGARDEDERGAFVGGLGDLSFVNSGTIATEPFENAVELGVEQARTVAIENSGQVTGGLSAYANFDRADGPGTLSFRNTGTIASIDEETSGIYVSITGKSGATVTLDNAGVLSAAGADSRAASLEIRSTYTYPGAPVELSAPVTYAVANSGTIEANGGGLVYEYNYGSGPRAFTSPASALAITADREARGTIVNTAAGRISATGERSTAIGVIGTALDLTNAGAITGTAGTQLNPADELARAAGQTFLAGAIHAYSAFGDIVRNTGTITGSIDLAFGDDRVENRGAIDGAVFLRAGDDTYLQGAGGSLTGVVDGGDGVDVIAVDAAGGAAVAAERFANFERLTQTGAGSVGYSGAFAAPTLELSGGTARVEAGRSFSTAGATAVTGSDAAEGVEVAGVLAGAVSLGGGDDLFAEIGEGQATGLVDGGAGVDLYRVALAGDREGLSANTGFERLGVEGAGTLSLTLAQDFEAVTLGGAGADVRLNGFAIGEVEGGAGADRFAADGDVARVFLGDGDDALRLTGADFAGLYEGAAGADVLRFSGEGPATLSGIATEFETVTVDGGVLNVTGALGGTAVSFGDGAQTFAVADGGRIQGTFDLGAGDDRFQLAAGGLLAGTVAGGAGRDAAAITLAGDRAFGADTLRGFELLSLDGAGTLSLTLDQALEAVTLSGVGLDVRLGGFGIGAVEGSDGAERFTADGDVARAALGAGDDLLSLGGTTLAGRYDGGAGADTLRLVGATTLTGQAVGFETLQLEQVTALTVRGVLSEAGERLLLGDGAQTIVNAGRIGGSLDLGGGDDVYGETAGAVLGGTVAGGAGADLYRVTLAGDRSGLSANTGFERLLVDGSGTLTASVEGDYELVTVSGAALSGALRFGGGNNRLVIAGGYQGSVTGGAGNDAIEVSSGSEVRPVAFGSIAEVETFRMTGGFATLSGSGALGSVDLSGGRLVGLAGSTMSASAFNVRQGAVFGSAGTVNGNVAVAGTLSPGASPGTMTVNGDVALQGTSVSVFEITPTASDQLVVNGAVSIANGATLQIVPTGQLQPGASLDLITASGGITGSFTNVVKPNSLFGFLVQQGGRLSLLGQFRNDASFSGQVGGTIDYANSVLVGGRANAALIAAAPGLVGANGTSNAGAFALLAPEAYASARQAAVEQGLTLADAGRGAGFANRRAEPGLFTFGQFAADQRTLRADGARGTARAKFGGYGLFGGLGYAGEIWSLGGFVGYLDGRQRLDGRGATTELTGAAFGVHGRADVGAFGLTATAAYAATEADTRRALPGGSARGTYDLTNLTLDVAATYEVAIGGEWSLKPRIGGTVVRVERDRVAETGSAAFAAQVAGDEDTAAFVDGALTAAKTGTVRPFATLGLRYQAAGRDAQALTGFGGGGLGLVVEGAERARVLGTAALGVEADLTPGITLFSAVAAERGEDDRRESARIGLRVDF